MRGPRSGILVVVLLAASGALAQDGAVDQGRSRIDPLPAEIAEPPSPDPAPPSKADRPPIPSWERTSPLHAGGPANDLNTAGKLEAAPLEGGEPSATGAIGPARPGPEQNELPGGSVLDALSGRALYHGNYCGYGNRGAGLPPTDALDAACQRHDACYTAAGHRSCACDHALAREAVVVADNPTLSREVRARAATVAEAANLMQCQSP